MTSDPPQRTVRLMGRSKRVYAATLWGVRHCQREGLRIDVEAMESFADWALVLLRGTCAEYDARARRRAMAR